METARTMQSPNRLPRDSLFKFSALFEFHFATCCSSDVLLLCVAACQLLIACLKCTRQPGKSQENCATACVPPVSTRLTSKSSSLFQSIDESLKQTPVANVPSFGPILGSAALSSHCGAHCSVDHGAGRIGDQRCACRNADCQLPCGRDEHAVRCNPSHRYLDAHIGVSVCPKCVHAQIVSRRAARSHAVCGDCAHPSRVRTAWHGLRVSASYSAQFEPGWTWPRANTVGTHTHICIACGCACSSRLHRSIS
jgi:hypothetical protein